MERVFGRPTSTVKLSISGTNASSTVTPGSTNTLRLYSDTDCFVSIGSAATTSSMPLAAGLPEYFIISETSYTVQAITGGTSGNLYITILVG